MQNVSELGLGQAVKAEKAFMNYEYYRQAVSDREPRALAVSARGGETRAIIAEDRRVNKINAVLQRRLLSFWQNQHLIGPMTLPWEDFTTALPKAVAERWRGGIQI
ncbi:hypothetical protein V8C35DRAFT_150767 [Trichoderma chlorosporum]